MSKWKTDEETKEIEVEWVATNDECFPHLVTRLRTYGLALGEVAARHKRFVHR